MNYLIVLLDIGGTLGLLTGFSLISAVEILFFIGKNLTELITVKMRYFHLTTHSNSGK